MNQTRSNDAASALSKAVGMVIALKKLAPGVDVTPLAQLFGEHLEWRRPEGMTLREKMGVATLCGLLDLNLPTAGA